MDEEKKTTFGAKPLVNKSTTSMATKPNAPSKAVKMADNNLTVKLDGGIMAEFLAMEAAEKAKKK